MILTLSAVSLSLRAFKALGIDEIAYVRSVVESADSLYEIDAADGTRPCGCQRGRLFITPGVIYGDLRDFRHPAAFSRGGSRNMTSCVMKSSGTRRPHPAHS